MFGFGSSSSSSSSSSSTTPVAGAAPNREERAACWTARDAYFTCLDQNGVIAAGDDKGPCQREKKGYEGSCSRSWVSLPLLLSVITRRRLISDRLFQQKTGVGDEAESYC
jgi:hypothetical protein